MDVLEIMKQLGLSDPVNISQFKSAEDGAEYEVWKVSVQENEYVVKKAKGHELAVYSAILKDCIQGAPRFLKSAEVGGETYFLMEYVPGKDLRKCDHFSLTAALDALIYLQDLYWENQEFTEVGFSFSKSLAGRQNRGKYLKDRELEQAYEAYLSLYSSLPRTLCHDDLLPFNVLVSEGRATIIDWEYAGILPYLTSLARLIAHGAENEDAFFYMTEADKTFAIEYYYEHLVKGKGIGYKEYRQALDCFLLYEYCEWIMLGNKYEDADMERCDQYYTKAKEHIKKLKP